jgi:hypothetical protein
MLNQYDVQGFLNGTLDCYRKFGDYQTTDDKAIAEAEKSFRFRQAYLKPGDRFTLNLRREMKLLETFPRLQDLMAKEVERGIAA